MKVVDLEVENSVTSKIIIELCRDRFGVIMTMVQAAEAMIVCNQDIKQDLDIPLQPGQKPPPDVFKKIFQIDKFAKFLAQNLPFMHTVEKSKFMLPIKSARLHRKLQQQSPL